MATRGPRPTAASLASTLATLAEAARRHADDPARMHDVVDRLSFRIRDTEDLFQFCPGAAQSGSGTIWGLICESGSVVAGVLIRRLLVERLGEEFELLERHRDAVMLALDEHPENIGLLEALCRCPSARAEYAERPRGLVHMAGVLERLRDLVLRAPPARVGADCGCVGAASALRGARDSDAFFAEADLLAAALELLLSEECRALPAACAAAGGQAAASLRRTCILVADISGLLDAHTRVLARIFAFLSSAAPLAFGPAHRPGETDQALFTHMLCTSACCHFVEDVLRSCGKSRMHDADDVQAVRVELLGQGRIESGRSSTLTGRVLDTRLMLCSALMMCSHLVEMFNRNVGEPVRFAHQAAEGFRERLLPRLRTASAAPLAGRWPDLRRALAALASAAERPTAPEAVVSGRAALRVWALAFLEAGTRLPAGRAELLLDPFGTAAPSGTAVAAAAEAGAEAPTGGSQPPGGPPLRPSSPELPPLGRAVASARARGPQECAAAARAAPLGDVPRRQGMRFEAFAEEHSLQRGSGEAPREAAPAAQGRVDLLPKPLPVSASRRAAPARARRPPGDARGFFYNAGTAEYIGC